MIEICVIFVLILLNHDKNNKTMKTVELKVINVVCGKCSSKLEKMLMSTEGVESATIDISSKILTMEYYPGIVTLDEVKSRFVEMGYDVEI